MELDNPISITKLSTFKEKDFCEVHQELSNANIIFVKQLSKKDKKVIYKSWKASYDGTSRNAVPTFGAVGF